jgi:hypothetical protein
MNDNNNSYLIVTQKIARSEIENVLEIILALLRHSTESSIILTKQLYQVFVSYYPSHPIPFYRNPT